MISWLTGIFDLLKGTIEYVSSLFEYLFSMLKFTFSFVTNAISFIGRLFGVIHPVLYGAALVTILVSVAYLIVGRETGH